MSTLKLTIPAAVLLAGFFVCTSTSYGTAEYAKKEKKGCVSNNPARLMAVTPSVANVFAIPIDAALGPLFWASFPPIAMLRRKPMRTVLTAWALRDHVCCSMARSDELKYSSPLKGNNPG